MLVCLQTERSIKKNPIKQQQQTKKNQKTDPASQACEKLKGVKKSSLNSILTAAAGEKHSKEVCYVKKRLGFICRGPGGPF